MAKGTPYQRYTPEIKQRVVEAVRSEGQSYTEAAKRYGISTHKLIQKWENIYLSEGPEGLSVERRGRGRVKSVKSPDGYEDMLEELKRLRAENDYLKKLHALVMEDERRRHKRRR